MRSPIPHKQYPLGLQMFDGLDEHNRKEDRPTMDGSRDKPKMTAGSVLDPGLWIPPVPFRREGDTCKGVGILGCRRQYIDPANQNEAEPLKGLRATPGLCREAACSSGLRHHFLHSRETSTST